MQMLKGGLPHQINTTYLGNSTPKIHRSRHCSTGLKRHWVSEEGEKQKKIQDLRYVIKALCEWRVGGYRCNLLCIVEQEKKMSPDRIHTQLSIEVPKRKGSNISGNLEVINMQSGK